MGKKRHPDSPENSVGNHPSYLTAGQFTRRAGKYTMKPRRLNLKWTEINMPELDLTKLIAHFAHSNTAEGKSPKTVSWYTEMLSDFVKFLTSTAKDAVLAEFNVSTARSFIIHEQARLGSPFTAHAISNFVRYHGVRQ